MAISRYSLTEPGQKLTLHNVCNCNAGRKLPQEIATAFGLAMTVVIRSRFF